MGDCVYHRYPHDLASQEIFQYTLMPQHIWQPILSLEELSRAELAGPMPFTKGIPILKIPVLKTSPMYGNDGPGALLENETRLYDLQADRDRLSRCRTS